MNWIKSIFGSKISDSEYKDGIFYLKNFEEFDSSKPLLVCFHGNSSIAETFGELITRTKGGIQVIAPDLPGCGRSKRLDEYSMSIVGKMMSNLITSFNPSSVYLFGHSLGGHLLAFIDVPQVKGMAMAGTPPISSMDDFPKAFTPGEAEQELIQLLMKEEPFTAEEVARVAPGEPPSTCSVAVVFDVGDP